VYDIDISESSSDNDEQKRERRGKRPQKLKSSQPSTRGRKTEQRHYEPKNEAVSIGQKVTTTKLSAADKDARKSWPSPIYNTTTGKETGNGQRQQLLGKTNMQFAATPTPLRSELGIALNVKQEQPETSTPDLWNPKASKDDVGRVTRSRLQKGVALKQSPTPPYNDSTSGYVSGPDDSKPDSDADVKPLKLKPSAANSFESHKKLDCKPSHKQTGVLRCWLAVTSIILCSN
jgi:hypothetical protein